MKVSYWNWSCQVFPGFYCSVFSDPLEYEECQDGYYLEIADYKKYMEFVAEEYVSNISFIDNPVDMQIGKCLGFDSPQYYNYYTDKIGLEIQVDMHLLEEHCWVTKAETFEEYLNNNWSSSSGFISYIPDNLHQFKREYYESECSALQDVMIEFYLLEYVDFQSVELFTAERCYGLAYESGVVLIDNKGNAYDYEYDNMTDMMIPVGEPITKVA